MNAEMDRIRVVLYACGGPRAGCGIQLTAIAGADDVRHAKIIPGDTVQIALDADAVEINYVMDSRKA